jgi:hypothetical protein
MRLTHLKKLYSLGHSYEKILHTRLRLGLSRLSKHLFSYNLCLRERERERERERDMLVASGCM